MSTYIRYPTTSGGGVPIYADFASLPSNASNGDLGVASDSGIVYEYRTGSSSWVAVAGPGFALNVGTFDSGVASANGAHIDTDSLIMQSASATVPGLVNTTTQSLAGNKTFTGSISASNLSGTNTGDVTLAAVGSSPSANAASLSGQVLTLQPADATHPGVVTTGAQTFAGSKTLSSLINADGGIDRSSAGTLTIGATNSTTINIGNSGATVNIQGTTIYENTPLLQVADPLITVNHGGGSGSGQNAGIEVEENAVITGYAETSSDRNSWIFKAPNTAGIVTMTPGSSGFVIDQASHDPLTLGAFGSSPSANAASLSGQVLTLQPADATHPGGISTTTQSLAGNKTFTGTIVASNLSGTNTGDVTLAAVGSTPGANGASLSGQVLTLQPADGTNPGLLTSGTQTIGGAKTYTGSITLPTTNFDVIKFGTDTNTGIYQSTANSIDMRASGTNRFSLTGSSILLTATVKATSVSGLGSNQAISGIFRLPNTGAIAWRNAAASADISLALDASNILQWGAAFTASGNILGANLSGTNTGDITLGAFGSTPSSTGSSLSGQVLTLQPADGTNPGGVSTTTQTFAGVKTFSSAPNLSSLTASLPLKLDGSKNITAAAINLSGSEITSTLAIGNGGTGQVTKSAAFDALSPMSASGDIIYGAASGTGTRLPKGSDGQILTLASGIPAWVNNSQGIWTSFPPTGSWTSNTTYTGFYKTVGDMLFVQVKVVTSGAPTSAQLTVDLPSGYTIDTSKLAATTLADSVSQIPFSGGNIRDNGVSDYSGVAPVYSSTTAVKIYIQQLGGVYPTFNIVTQLVPMAWGASDALSFFYAVPWV